MFPLTSLTFRRLLLPLISPSVHYFYLSPSFLTAAADKISSCSPNTTPVWDPSQLTLRIRAVRHIRAGDELLVSYEGKCLEPQAERQATLRRKYKFDCKCSACLIPASVSDPRRMRLCLGALDLERWEQWRSDPPTSRAGMISAVRECDEMLKMVLAEGLDGICLSYAIYMDWRARALVALADDTRFLAAAKEAALAWAVLEGKSEDSEYAKGFDETWKAIAKKYELGMSVPGWGKLGSGSWTMQWEKNAR
jgi:hypothetical protein